MCPNSAGPPLSRGGATPAAIEHHYDVGSEFYRLWLDEMMVYSCALWDGPADEDLDAAQRAKLDWHVASAGAHGAARVLDVGCGWGAMLRHLTEVHGVGHATGLTLSSDQARVASASSCSAVEVRLEDWRDHLPEEPYDAIVSIGAFEHFARNDLNGEERRSIYSSFFAACAGWLNPGCRLSLQTIAYEDFDPAAGVASSFFTDDIFPESSLPVFPDIARASDPWFRTLAVRNDGEHYERTLCLWQRRLEANRDSAIEVVGRDTYRRYLRYLRVARAMFGRQVCTLYRITLERRPQAVRVASAATEGGAK